MNVVRIESRNSTEIFHRDDRQLEKYVKLLAESL